MNHLGHPISSQAVEKGTLYVVATPIGNLSDLSPRALSVLSQVSGIAAEDTRVTAQLLAHFGIKTPLCSLREHNEQAMAARLIERLKAGESLAQVSDAGTPAISDPGARLVRAVQEAGLPVVPIPGCNAAVTALSASGILAPHFLFLGFLSAKRTARRAALLPFIHQPYALVVYEAPHRIVDLAEDLEALLAPQREIVFARELSKTFEHIHRCTAETCVAWLQEDTNHQRGEFVVMIEAPVLSAEEDYSEAFEILECLLEELSVSSAVRLAQKLTDVPKKKLYDHALLIEKQKNTCASEENLE